MSVGAREFMKRVEFNPRAAMEAARGLLAGGDSQALESPVAERLYAAQIVAATRHSWAVVAANIGNALMIVVVMAHGPRFIAALSWLGALILYLAPLVRQLYLRLGRAAPLVVSKPVIRSAVINAGLLGVIWGAAPVLFFNSNPGADFIVACVCVGMLCGGAFAMATIPAAVIAYVIPLTGGCLIALLWEAHELAHFLTAPLLLSYAVILIGGASSHARTFAEKVVAQLRAELTARHDPLTGLPNRAAFNAAIEDAFDRLARYGERFALLYIDLDDFKAVNDQWGHQVGDQLLRLASNRLSDALNERGMIARLGGDEFVVIVRGVFDAEQASNLAADVSFRFDAPFALDGRVAHCGASVGAALAPRDGSDAVTLLRAADLALYRAKRAAKGAPHLPRTPDDLQARHRRELTQDMKAAVTRGEFFLQYQPIQSLRSGRIQAFEALVRWRHPRLGVIPPGKFIDIAEKTGIIHELGEWILREACREAAGWPAQVRVAVNMSGEQLFDASIDRIVESALRLSGLPPHRLQVEVTESAALAAMREAASALRRIHDRGVAIVLDDFGTGFSSFDHIRRLPVSRLKIDRSFVTGLPGDEKSSAILNAVVHLAQALNLGVTAEGIETEEQLAFLEQAGFSSGQGYLFARPLSASDARAMLSARQPRARTVA
jgi:diguanylate cyclase